MATKKQQADDAYEKVEAQRALGLVLNAATDFSIEMKDWAGATEIDALDAALDRVRSFYLPAPEAPARSTELPGQIGLDGNVVGEPVAAHDPLPERSGPLMGVPSLCPSCGRSMLIVIGTSWTPMTRGIPSEPALQCGQCGWIESVQPDVQERVRAARQEMHRRLNAAPVKVTRGKRVRGAG